MKFFLSYILVIFLFISCIDKIDSREFEVINNSNQSIYTIIHKVNIEDDTINKYGFVGDFTDSILSNTIKEINRPIDWGRYMNKSYGMKFRLYLIKKDSIDKYGWEGIRKKNIYNKKYILDIDDLDSLNWRIKYDGTHN
ncbi:hypothetical protein [Flavobacterium macacae]|uniref:Lipoprotein n=1 Tax=Flavobacterium macacae TaxID=2488993 RepID=A0A3P3VWC5_9FLAO|nr:hypothetical protein [Flavobacterium macacae]RRJ87101.1 hypothetical protein EG849_15455 [Flavobacterium macacae]